jgi:DNA-directed RNA polymerase specialized sigma24 family protein
MDLTSVQAPTVESARPSLEAELAPEFPAVLNYVTRLIDNLDAAPGIATEAIRRVLDKTGSNKTLDQLRLDIYKVATELGQRWLRPRRFFRRSESEVNLTDFPHPDTRRALRKDTVQRALMALSPEARSLVLLRDSVHLSYDELSRITRASPKKLVHALDQARAELLEVYGYIKF